MSSVDLDFARNTLREVEEWRSKIRNQSMAFDMNYRTPYNEDLYFIIDSFGKDDQLETARVKQIIRESIEAAEAEVKGLVEERLRQTNVIQEISPKISSMGLPVKTDIRVRGKPWLPRVALLPPKKLVMRQKAKEREEQAAQIQPLRKCNHSRTKPITFSQLMEPKVQSPKYNELVHIQPALANSKSVDPKKKAINETINPTVNDETQYSKENAKPVYFKAAIPLSRPFQLRANPTAFKDSTSNINLLPQKKLTHNTIQRNVAVLNIIKDDVHPKRLSVQVLPSISIECKYGQSSRTKKNVQLLVKKGDMSQSSTSSSTRELPPVVKSPKEAGLISGMSNSSTQTQVLMKSAGTSFDINQETIESLPYSKAPVDTTTIRQLLHQLINDYKEEYESGKQSELVKEVSQLKLRNEDVLPSTESRGILTDMSERKSQYVSMEIETRSLGISTEEKTYKTQEVQAQIGSKEFKDASILAEVSKEFKDISTLTSNLNAETKTIGIQVWKEEEIEMASVQCQINLDVTRSTEDKFTEVDVELSHRCSESSESTQSLPKASLRDMGVQVSSSSDSNFSLSNETSSAIVSSSTTSTSNISSDEPISEGEIVFKRPFPPIPKFYNRVPSQWSVELSVTEELEEDNQSLSEGELHSENDRQLESAQSVGEIIITSEPEDVPLKESPSLSEPSDGATSSSPEENISRQ